MMLGIPDFTTSHAGVDQLGVGCRIDRSVSVMRFGDRADVLWLADGVSLYANTRLVLGDVVADPRVGIRIGARTIVNVGGYLSGEGGLEIGEDVLIGPHVKLLSAGHVIDEGEVVTKADGLVAQEVDHLLLGKGGEEEAELDFVVAVGGVEKRGELPVGHDGVPVLVIEIAGERFEFGDGTLHTPPAKKTIASI